MSKSTIERILVNVRNKIFGRFALDPLIIGLFSVYAYFDFVNRCKQVEDYDRANTDQNKVDE